VSHCRKQTWPDADSACDRMPADAPPLPGPEPARQRREMAPCLSRWKGHDAVGDGWRMESRTNQPPSTPLGRKGIAMQMAAERGPAQPRVVRARAGHDRAVHALPNAAAESTNRATRQAARLPLALALALAFVCTD